MELLLVARERPGVEPTSSEVTDQQQARELLPRLPHGTQILAALARMSIGVMVLAQSMERPAARAALSAAIGRSQPRGLVVLGSELGRELLGEGLALTGGVREMHSRPIGALGRATGPETERILSEVCQRAGIPWAPLGARAAPARAVMRADDAVVQAAALIEKQQWAEAVAALHAGEPLGPRGTNMLGRALLGLGDTDGARAAFERTLAAEPGNSIAQRQLATLGVEVAGQGRAASPARGGAARSFKRVAPYTVVAQDDGNVTYEVQAAMDTDGHFAFPKEVQLLLGVKVGDEVRLRIVDRHGQEVFSGVQRIKGGDEIRDKESLAWGVNAGQRIRVTAERR